MERLNLQKFFCQKGCIFIPAKTTRAASQLYLLGINKETLVSFAINYISTKSKKIEKIFYCDSFCQSSNLNLYLKVKHVYFPLVQLTIYLLMVIISHSELDSQLYHVTNYGYEYTQVHYIMAKWRLQYYSVAITQGCQL